MKAPKDETSKEERRETGRNERYYVVQSALGIKTRLSLKRTFMRATEKNARKLIGLAILFIIFVSPLTDFDVGEMAASEDRPRKHMSEMCTPPLFYGLAKDRNSITIPTGDSFKDAIKKVDVVLKSMPNAQLVVTTFRANDEDKGTDLRRAKYIRDLVSSGKLSVTIDPKRIVLWDRGVPEPRLDLSGKEVFLVICYSGEYSITPKNVEFPDASLSFSIKETQEKIKTRLLEFFKAIDLLTVDHATEGCISIITAYDYSELKVRRRNKRASYLVQICPSNEDGHCLVKLKYLIQSKGDREKTWSVTEEDAQAKPKQLKVIADQIDSLADREHSK